LQSAHHWLQVSSALEAALKGVLEGFDNARANEIQQLEDNHLKQMETSISAHSSKMQTLTRKHLIKQGLIEKFNANMAARIAAERETANNPFKGVGRDQTIAVYRDFCLPPRYLDAFPGSFMHAKFSGNFADHPLKVDDEDQIYLNSDRSILKVLLAFLSEENARDSTAAQDPRNAEKLLAAAKARVHKEVSANWTKDEVDIEIDALLGNKSQPALDIDVFLAVLDEKVDQAEKPGAPLTEGQIRNAILTHVRTKFHGHTFECPVDEQVQNILELIQ
jgi:hypothetical protein